MNSKTTTSFSRILKMRHIIHELKSLLFAHYTALMVELDFVHNLSQVRRRKAIHQNVQFSALERRLHFVFEFFISIGTLLIGTIGLHLQSNPSDWNLLELRILKKSNQIFFHQLFPSHVWQTTDVIILFILLSMIVISGNSICTAKFEEKFRMVKKKDAKERLEINGKSLYYLTSFA